MKKIIIALAAVIAVCAALCACSGLESSSSGGKSGKALSEIWKKSRKSSTPSWNQS